MQHYWSALVPCVNLWHFRRRQRACWTRGTATGGRLQSYLVGDNLLLKNTRGLCIVKLEAQWREVCWSPVWDNLLPHQCQLRTFKNTCGNYIVDFGSYSLWSNCGRILSILAPILGTTFLSGPFAAQCQLRTPLIQLISLFSSTMSGRSPHVMFNLGGIHACLGTHVSVDHMWRNMQLGCFADGKYCW